MTQRRSSAPGRVRPDRRRSSPLRALPAVLVMAMLVAACGTTADATSSPPRPTPTPFPTFATITPTEAPGSAAPTDAPATTGEPEATDDAGSSGAPEPTATDAGPAAVCAGNDENRAFFASVAAAVDWPVYCPVLGDGWFVASGQYRLAGGGRLEISYRGPGGAGLALREGFYCDGDCSPDGTDLGPAAFGDLDGALRDIGGGAFAVVVDPAGAPSWELVVTGSSEDAARAIAADLAGVGG